METSFWLQKWEKNEIAFHQKEANPLLVKYFADLSLAKGSRVFVPFCGKSLDVGWLLSQGHRVAGAELSKLAVEQLFAGLGCEPEIVRAGEFERYSAADIDIFVGDLFNVSGELLGGVDAIYDRAALVALPNGMRNQYSKHLTEITGKAPQLLITYEYDQSVMAGPPFSVCNEEVKRLYRDSYDLRLVASEDVAGGLKGRCAATEHVWMLRTVVGSQ
ncbi:MAG: tpm [Acidobacteriales bacterium]|nr:tpm [Terriglobales bacterium]